MTWTLSLFVFFLNFYHGLEISLILKLYQKSDCHMTLSIAIYADKKKLHHALLTNLASGMNKKEFSESKKGILIWGP